MKQRSKTSTFFSNEKIQKYKKRQQKNTKSKNRYVFHKEGMVFLNVYTHICMKEMQLEHVSNK